MPKRILIGEEARDVASFVAAYAGQIGTGPTVDISAAGKPEPRECAERSRRRRRLNSKRSARLLGLRLRGGRVS